MTIKNDELMNKILSRLDEETIKKLKNAKSVEEVSELMEHFETEELTDEELDMVSGGWGCTVCEAYEYGDVREDYDSEKVPSEFVEGEIDGSVVFDEE